MITMQAYYTRGVNIAIFVVGWFNKKLFKKGEIIELIDNRNETLVSNQRNILNSIDLKNVKYIAF